PAKNDSQYSKVKLWISKGDGALMQAEAFDHDGRFARRFKVLSGQKTDQGLWMLKQMRIEAASMSSREDRTPTYLEIDKPKS
ncbi:MAG: outer membrane lipoprotein-sorting protein, partial [Chthoniobacteraceae bacterium]